MDIQLNPACSESQKYINVWIWGEAPKLIEQFKEIQDLDSEIQKLDPDQYYYLNWDYP